MKYLPQPEYWDRGFESYARYGCLFVLGNGLATGWSPIQDVLPTVLDWETEVKRSVSWVPYAPSGSNRNRRRRRRRKLKVWHIVEDSMEERVQHSTLFWMTLFQNVHVSISEIFLCFDYKFVTKFSTQNCDVMGNLCVQISNKHMRCFTLPHPCVLLLLLIMVYTDIRKWVEYGSLRLCNQSLHLTGSCGVM
jgi:hypothetical protein